MDKARTLVARTDRIRTRFSRAKTDRGTKPSDPPGRGRKSGLARSRICARHADPHPRCRPRPTTSFRVRISDIDGIQGSPPCHRQTRARLPAIDEPRTHLLAVNQLPGSRPSRRSTSSFAPYPSVQLGSAFAHRRVYGFARHPSAHPWFGFRPSAGSRVRISAIDAMWVRLLDIWRPKTASDGQSPNPRCADGPNPNPRCTDGSPNPG